MREITKINLTPQNGEDRRWLETNGKSYRIHVEYDVEKKGRAAARANRFGGSTVDTSHMEWEIRREEAENIIAAEEAKAAKAAAARDTRSARDAQCEALAGLELASPFRINDRGEVVDQYGNYITSVPASAGTDPAAVRDWFAGWQAAWQAACDEDDGDPT